MLREILSAIVPMAVSGGVTTVVTNAILATTPKNINFAERISVTIGAVSISAWLSNKVTSHVSGKLDELYESLDKAKTVNKEIEQVLEKMEDEAPE